MRRHSIVPVLALLLGACLSNATGPGGGVRVERVGLDAQHRVLFVGNSLTYWNDLPWLVERLATLNGESLHAAAVVGSGWSLEDHWAAGHALDSIGTRHFTHVVLQQGPSALESSREILRAMTRKFDVPIREAGATPALYAVWPSAERSFDFDRVHESYALAAEDVGGALFPVGRTWQAAWAIQPDLKLWSSDGLHPTPAATYLAAIVIHARIHGELPAVTPERVDLATGRAVGISTRDLATIRQAAAQIAPR